jgi:hypothetical protein
MDAAVQVEKSLKKFADIVHFGLSTASGFCERVKHEHNDKKHELIKRKSKED